MINLRKVNDFYVSYFFGLKREKKFTEYIISDLRIKRTLIDIRENVLVGM
jgi:hypothetical protein